MYLVVLGALLLLRDVLALLEGQVSVVGFPNAPTPVQISQRKGVRNAADVRHAVDIPSIRGTAGTVGFQ